MHKSVWGELLKQKDVYELLLDMQLKGIKHNKILSEEISKSIRLKTENDFLNKKCTTLQHDLLTQQLNYSKLNQDYVEVSQELLQSKELVKKNQDLTSQSEENLKSTNNTSIGKQNLGGSLVSPRSYPIQEMRELEDALEELNSEKNAYLELKHKWEETLKQLDSEKNQKEAIKKNFEALKEDFTWKQRYEELEVQ